MINYKAIVKYDGTKYQGWQRQTSTDNTIQAKLEKVLQRMSDTVVNVNGAGRTDAGVHAYGQVISFELPNQDKSPEEIEKYMNQYLPEDICVCNLCIAPSRFHSRLNAKGKIYRYRIWFSNEKPIFEKNLVYVVERKPDVEKMKEAAKFFIGEHDFAGFTSAKRSKKSTVRIITDISIEETKQEIVITYRGNGFLYHMVRIITGTLLEVGWGERSTSSVKQLISDSDSGEMVGRSESGHLVPGKGLALMKVLYDEL